MTASIVDLGGAALGLFDAISAARSGVASDRGVLRSTRRHNVELTIDAPGELGLVLSLSEAHHVERRMQGRSNTTPPRVGAVTLLPPGIPTHFTLSGQSNALMFRLSWQRLTHWLAEDHGVDPDRVELQPRFHALDPMLARLMYRAVADGDSHTEEVGRAVASQLLMEHATEGSLATPPRARGGLSPARLRRVLDRIEAGLAGPLPLASLASEANLSPFHFAREFERIVGAPPHRYVLGRRVDRAIGLLSDAHMSIGDIALATGFSGTSHLARHLRRQTGLSPHVFRSRVLP